MPRDDERAAVVPHAGAERTSRPQWRSLEELAGGTEFEERLAREFSDDAAVWPPDVDRRRFLQLAGASMALAGLTGCTRQPPEKIIPYVEQPEHLVPGRPLYFATGFELDGYASGILVESHMGRPTKVEGNPEHPASRGATDLFAQASILSLYDPDRSQAIRHVNRTRTWDTFVGDTTGALQTLAALGEVRLRILTGPVTSPSLSTLLGRLLAAHPSARWHQYSPAGTQGCLAAAESAFGRPLSTRFDFTSARVVLALDSDFLNAGPGAVRYARDLMRGRRVRETGDSMNRLYVAETTPTGTGATADHRLPVAAGRFDHLVLALARELGVEAADSMELSADEERWITAAAADLAAHRGASAVVAGEYCSPEVQVLAHAMNERLGAGGRTVLYSEPIEARPTDPMTEITALADDMRAGEVDVLLVIGANPVFDAPAECDFATAMTSVGRRIHLGLYDDETGELCHWHVPMAHQLESWGDARSYDGTVTLRQPLIEPLFRGRSAATVLSVFATEGARSDREVLEDHWRARLGEDFDRLWPRAVHDGFVADTALPSIATEVSRSAVEAAAAAIADRVDDSLTLVFRPDPTIFDGSLANNAWLQECPKPLSKLTWDNAAVIGPALANRLGVTNEQLVRLDADGRTLELPVWIQPGQPDETITVHLGHGRTRAGRVGNGTGFNAYRLRTAATPWRVAGVTLAPLAGSHPLATTQLHHNIAPRNIEGEAAHDRHLVRTAALSEYREHPDFARHVTHGPEGDVSLYPPVAYEGHAWGMSIDLGACTACNACVIACQSENNIPTVGKEQVLNGREMHWIRIDRYFEGDLDDPAIHHQPVLCMHCEQAPCEVVCPVAATTHSDEGLNEMTYNRCVGTRYCSNNCAYKVRRFNFLKYVDDDDPVLRLLRNPDVTVRTRGVMEKCTYCVQRINHARIAAANRERPVGDGEILTACQQACPTEAIVFGDCNDPGSRLAGRKANSLDYGILEELSTKPRTTYMARVTNPNPVLGGKQEKG